VHLSATGCPVSGDPLYGGKEHAASRLMLHAACVRLRTTAGGDRVEIRSVPPGDFLEIIRQRMGGEAVEVLRAKFPESGRAR
jgi:hypothetical protein